MVPSLDSIPAILWERFHATPKVCLIVVLRWTGRARARAARAPRNAARHRTGSVPPRRPRTHPIGGPHYDSDVKWDEVERALRPRGALRREAPERGDEYIAAAPPRPWTCGRVLHVPDLWEGANRRLEPLSPRKTRRFRHQRLPERPHRSGTLAITLGDR
jgi:hypothetical protein